MYEPPHWTKPRQAPIAKAREPADTPTKPSTAPSIEDLAESIKTLKDGLRAMADQVAGLTARVDDLAHPLILGVDHGTGDQAAQWTPEEARAHAVANGRQAFVYNKEKRTVEPLTPPDRVKQYERLGYRQMIIDHEGGEPFAWVHEGNGCWSRDGLMEAAIRVRLPNDFLTKMEEAAARGERYVSADEWAGLKPAPDKG